MHEVLVTCCKTTCDVVASDKEHDFVRLGSDFVSQLGLQLNIDKLVEVCCSRFFTVANIQLISALLNCLVILSFEIDKTLSVAS